MKIKKSVRYPDLRFVTVQIPQDRKGFRTITYSWPNLLNAGTKEVFPYVFRKRYYTNHELNGIYYSPETTLLIRCIKGCCRILYTDMRSGAKFFHKTDAAVLSVKNHMQIYIPAGVAWSVVTLNDEVELQIQASRDINAEQPVIFDPMDETLDVSAKTGIAEFSIAAPEYPTVSVTEYEEMLERLEAEEEYETELSEEKHESGEDEAIYEEGDDMDHHTSDDENTGSDDENIESDDETNEDGE